MLTTPESPCKNKELLHVFGSVSICLFRKTNSLEICKCLIEKNILQVKKQWRADQILS